MGKKFNYFTRHHEFALVPIMHLLIKKAFESIEKNPDGWGVTDSTTANVPQVIRILAFNGHILKIDGGKTQWYNDECTDSLSFDNGLYIYGKEEACQDFLENLLGFAKTLDQNTLMSEAKGLIGNSGILPIPWEWKEFYDL
ncbi:MAG: hypothetical protein NTX14_00810 [Candidatus Nealsonbacteria bacterium]|nr:hypothetical protein [Candidatus Nealsonbacteria bacterium]